MPLMGSLYIGASGLQSSQNVLNTTAHNLTNLETRGYTRQQSLLSTRSYNVISSNSKSVSKQQLGLGVNYSTVRQVRDNFMDKTYRRESGRSMFYEVSTEVMTEVEGLLGEMNGEDFASSLGNLWGAVQELSKDPSSSVTQGLLVRRASEFIQRATSVYKDLCDYQDNLNLQIKKQVDTINQYGKQINMLNDKIREVESGGIEHANDLRDARNQILDDLSNMVKMSYKEDKYGSVSVQIEGVDFVKAGQIYEIGLQAEDGSGFYTPFWPQNANYTVQNDGSKKYDITHAKVYDINQIISTTNNTDIGSLKAMLLARGTKQANYTDINNNYDDISQSIIMNIQAEFDQLIHNVVTKVNDVLAAAYDPANEYMCDENGGPLQLFQKVNTSGYTYNDATDKWEYMNEDPDNAGTLYTLKNLKINSTLMETPSKLGFKLKDGSADFATAEALKNAFTEESYTLNPNVQKKTNFVNYYSDLVSQVANSGANFQSIYANQIATVDAASSAREQVSGVSSDEELSNMIKFQNAYNASSRYINVIGEMLEHIINTLAM